MRVLMNRSASCARCCHRLRPYRALARRRSIIGRARSPLVKSWMFAFDTGELALEIGEFLIEIPMLMLERPHVGMKP